jgi:hypothetical protein
MTEMEKLLRLAGIDARVLKENTEPQTGDIVAKTVVGHVDSEADMLRKELYKIGKYAVELHKMLGTMPEGDLPHWWQSKIIKSGEYISAAKHYLEAELNQPADEKTSMVEHSNVLKENAAFEKFRALEELYEMALEVPERSHESGELYATVRKSLAEHDKMKDALEEIRDRHIPDQPMANDISDEAYVRSQYKQIRLLAHKALNQQVAENLLDLLPNNRNVRIEKYKTQDYEYKGKMRQYAETINKYVEAAVQRYNKSQDPNNINSAADLKRAEDFMRDARYEIRTAQIYGEGETELMLIAAGAVLPKIPLSDRIKDIINDIKNNLEDDFEEPVSNMKSYFNRIKALLNKTNLK